MLILAERLPSQRALCFFVVAMQARGFHVIDASSVEQLDKERGEGKERGP